MKLIWQARAQTDPIDARKLAELLRVNLFPSIWLPDTETRERRQLLRARAVLVRERTRLKHRIHDHLRAENLVAPGSDRDGKGGRAWLAAAPLSTVVRAQTPRLLTLHDALTTEIAGRDCGREDGGDGESRGEATHHHAGRRRLPRAVPPRRDRRDHALSLEP